MNSYVFIEENGVYQFDFRAAIHAVGNLNEIFHSHNMQVMCDSDFIAETENEIIVLEYKNSNIPNAMRADAFKPSEQKHLHKIARKFYDTWIFLKATSMTKPIRYVYVLEYAGADSVQRRMIRDKILCILPFSFQQRPDVRKRMIDSFEVLSISEWNSHDKYKAFPITMIDNPA